MAWADLPPDLLRLVFASRQPCGCPVLGLDERARAEAVCRPWRAALAAEPPALDCLELSDADGARSRRKAEWAVQRRAAFLPHVAATPPAEERSPEEGSGHSCRRCGAWGPAAPQLALTVCRPGTPADCEDYTAALHAALASEVGKHAAEDWSTS